MRYRTRALLFVALSAAIVAPNISAHLNARRGALRQTASPSDASRLAQLETRLENLRQQLKIPAFSAAVVKERKVIWARGFGLADVENKIPATEHTPYHLASLTKTFASTILLQLVEQGKVKLDDPVSKYGVALESEGVIRVRHLLSHTSEGNPGESYRYNGNRFAELDKVIEKAGGKSFAELLIANILEPLGMNETAPNVPVTVGTKSPDGVQSAAEAEVKAALTNLIEGYNSGNVEQIERHVAPQQNGFQGEGGFLTNFVDTAELRGAFQSGFKLNFQLYNLEAAVYGNTALTTFIMDGMVTPPNGTPRKDGPWRTSIVWNKQDSVWKIVHSHKSALNRALITEKHRQRFDTVSKTLAQPYALDAKFNVNKIKYPTSFSVSAGLISTVLDMAKYDIAIDQNKFLTRATQQLAFTPTVSTKGETLPYGLGWFTQSYQGTKLIWHYGYWTGNSSFILKVPERNLTFIVMANTDNLSRPTDLGAGDALSSPVGLAFLKTFVLPEVFGESMAEINWQAPAPELQEQLKRTSRKPYANLYTKELITQVRIAQSTGRRDEALRLMKLYGVLYSKPLPEELSKRLAVAQIVGVGDAANQSVEFVIAQSRRLRIFATGEGQAGQMFDYGWIEDATTGKTLWEMKEPETTHAGGASKNRHIDTVITLPAGNYKLHYKSDDSHSFDNWNSLPPDINFWGIALYTMPDGVVA